MEKFEPFLLSIAKDLKEKCGGNPDLSHFTVVFPNKRAGLFFDKHLYHCYNENVKSDIPVWSPKYTTINELFARCAEFLPGNLKVLGDEEKMELVFLLYLSYNEVYAKHLQLIPDEEQPKVNAPQPFDEFYFFGELLLKDFDDIDKNMVDADKLFVNFAEYETISEKLDYLTDDQKKAITEFFNVQFDDDTSIFKNFISLWKILADVYHNFKARLQNKGIAYEGMAERMVVVSLKTMKSSLGFYDETFVFVGFNALNVCEKELLNFFYRHVNLDDNNRPKNLFYWDYDKFYFDDSGNRDNLRRFFKDDAGTFLRQNLCGDDANKTKPNASSVFLRLGNELKNGNHDFLSRFGKGKSQIDVIASSTDTAVAKFVSKYLKDKKEKEHVADDDIAIVLCDESLLLPILHAVPDCVESLNVTMGFPLVQTPAFLLLNQLLDLQSKCSRKQSTSNTLVCTFMFPQVSALMKNSEVRRVLGSLADVVVDEFNLQNKFYITTDDIVNVVSKHADSDEASIFLKLLFSAIPDSSVDLLHWMIDVVKSVSSSYASIVDSDKLDLENGVEDPLVNKNNLAGLYEEALYKIYSTLNQIDLLLSDFETPNLDLFRPALLFRLVRKLLSTVSVTYSGEPAKGVQIMGFLETRNLDFKHLLMLSVNDEFMPRSGRNVSIIPYGLRVGFGLPTVEHEDALYAYNFYRLMHRPQSITMLFNSDSSEKSGEPSRFLRQLKAECGAFDGIKNLSSQKIITSDDDVIEIAKTADVVEKLKHRFGDDGYVPLSPSKLKDYVNCTLKFYFSVVLGLKENLDFDENMDESTFGNIFHGSMQQIYLKICGKNEDRVVRDQTMVNRQRPYDRKDWCVKVTPEMFGLITDKDIVSIVDSVFKQYMNVSQMTGEQLVKRGVLFEFVKRQLMFDLKCAQNGDFEIFSPEYHISQPVTIEQDGHPFNFWLGGIVDRRDRVAGQMRVVDYKTGSSDKRAKMSAPDLNSLFGDDASGKPVKKIKEYILQTMVYSYLLNINEGDNVKPYNQIGESVKLGLMFPVEMISSTEYNPMVSVHKAEVEMTPKSEIVDEFGELLKNTLVEILDVNVPFRSTEFVDRCTFCSFSKICHREEGKRK